MEWRGTLLIDTVLPFGLRAVPKIFCALSDTVEWIAMSQGMSAGIHYIDDFLTFGSSEAECARNLEILCHVCQRLGFLLAQDKVESPSQKLSFLGIELDYRKLEMRLPADKLRDLRQEVANWHVRKAATKRQLLSLIGHLTHATKVVIPGRIFLRRMIDLSAKAKQLNHWVHLNQEFRSVVEAVSYQVEWHFNAPSPWIGPTGRDMLNRCLGEVGLCGGLAIKVAGGSMATQLGGEKYCRQRTGTNCAGSSHVGSRMGP